jgi:two-component system NtrC family sensor kinase
MPSAPIPHNEASRLQTLHRYAILDSLPEQELDDITRLASFICDTPISLISLVDTDRQWFKSKVGLAAPKTGRSESFCAHILSDGHTMIVEDTLSDDRFVTNPLVTDQPGIRFYAGAPLIAPNGHILGSLCVIDTKPRSLSPQQVDALESLSRQVIALFESRLRFMEAQRNAAALMQSEKLAAVGRVASSMAHEINNPLEAVTNLLYLSRQNAVDADVKQWLDDAEVELRRISIIANQTLRFHKQSTRAQATTCTSLFSTTLNLYESRLKNAGIVVEKRKRANEPVACFEGDVRQVLSNLITNAIDAMPFGGRLIVRSREATDWRTGRKGLALTIADTGAGMDHDTQCRMFEAFFTTKGINGNGLGLWISADIMARHQGTISIRSSKKAGSSGTAVVLFLPFEMSADGDASGTRSEDPQAASAPSRAR